MKTWKLKTVNVSSRIPIDFLITNLQRSWMHKRFLMAWMQFGHFGMSNTFFPSSSQGISTPWGNLEYFRGLWGHFIAYGQVGDSLWGCGSSFWTLPNQLHAIYNKWIQFLLWFSQTRFRTVGFEMKLTKLLLSHAMCWMLY